MTIKVKHAGGSYNIAIGRGYLSKAGQFARLNRRVFIVTDDGVPAKYAESVAGACKAPTVYTLPQGEKSKSLGAYRALLDAMIQAKITRSDCVAAVGGGVVGDLAGFAAATYLRGVDFYNFPTTFLSQVDASIGGKTALNFGGYKNLVGAFHQPKAVCIDPDTLRTLPPRQMANGLAEAVKMAMTSDKKLFALFESGEYAARIEEVMLRALRVKKRVVEKDENETMLRRVLNFGHTVAHALESENALSGLYHGECVALGMIPMCSEKARERLIPVLKKIGLPTFYDYDWDKIYDAVTRDKKVHGGVLTTVFVDQIGSFRFVETPLENLKKVFQEAFPADKK